MPKRDKLLAELDGDENYGVLLMAQMDSVPETVQFFVSTTRYDEAAQGLRDQGNYVIRAISVQEHRVSVGLFSSMRVVDDHPLLHQYNATPAGLFFRGQPDNANELVLDLFQAYASTYGPWRQMPTYLNTAKPLVELLQDGGGLLGEMPLPLAERMAKALEHHELETNIIKGKIEDPPMQLMLLDHSYIIAMSFSVDILGKA
jgi:hypothetical protein